MKHICIVCGVNTQSPREGDRLDCGKPECRAVVERTPWEVLNYIRMQDALEVWREHPPGGPGTYIHVDPA